MPGPRLTVATGLCALLLAACSEDRQGSEGDDTGSSGSGGSVSFDCTEATETFAGHVIIETEADLAQLQGVRAVEGELQVDKTTLADLDFLGCIEQVGDTLTIFGNTELTDVSGLASLTRVGGSFIVSENPAVVDLDGANALAEVAGSVVIQGNAAMTGISGLNSLATIGAAINIRSNPVLEHIDGLQGLRTVGGQLAITQNPNLCISSINRVGEGITSPTVIPDNWSTRSNDDSC